MNTSTNYDDLALEGRALVALFADRDSARSAIASLHDEGFHRPWLGVTSPGTTSSTGGTEVQSDDDGPMGAIGRFFTGESGGHPLREELVRHGVSEDAASRMDLTLPANSCVLTVDGSNHPELAAQIIEQNGGHIVSGESFTGSTSTTGAASALRLHDTGTAALGYASAATTARGENIDEQRRLQLREERLNIAKESVSAGEAVVGKDVVSHEQVVDVPVYHEELYIEQRPASDTTTSDLSPIGEGDVIRVPLTAEQLQVSKRVVQTGEVVVGKRRVTETQNVRETIREEKLRVDNGTTVSGTVNGTDTATVDATMPRTAL